MAASLQFQTSKNPCKLSRLQGLLFIGSLILGWGVAIPSTIAAETVTIRFGPFQQSVAIADLEKFAKTGTLPKSLQAYESLLTPELRRLLNRRLQVDPKFADKFVDEIVLLPQGKQFLTSLETAIPGSTSESLQAAISIGLRQVNGLSVVSFLKAYPTANIDLDATQLLQIASEFNPNNLQSQALGSLLARDLAVKTNTPFQANFNPAAPGKEEVQQQTLTFPDKQRQRNISVDIYTSPKTDKTAPLVIISHGFGANRKFASYLARHLAAYGITVVAVEHPGSNAVAITNAANQGDLAKLLPATEFMNRPKDISFLLNELATINRQPGQLQGKFNTEKVTVIGHSLGGYTALALVGGEVNLDEVRQFCKTSLSVAEAPGDWLQCAAASLKDKKLQLRDERVKSAIALNPLIGTLFGKQGLSRINQPVLMLTATEDALTPALTHQLRPFTQLRSEKYLLTAIGATHLSIVDPAYPVSEFAQVIQEKRGQAVQPLRQLIQGVSLAFIKQLTPEAKTYQPFLTSAYAQSLSTPEIPLRLNAELPTTIKPWLNLAVK
ncbi:alpha/beta hydrolase [Nostoc sp. FACHB-110]|uniref:alpha/beta hydrolase n=1 Tax=Nostoc sp. FACHB-110 TaxID=2692834 RepID=UPI0016839885|nr:alpha/beta hydrolase [Nostoc sp. FACHB-110]MBD2439853.1 alpha/beta hydrolase [Nostoc sp. FACHB-110]